MPWRQREVTDMAGTFLPGWIRYNAALMDYSPASATGQASPDGHRGDCQGMDGRNIITRQLARIEVRKPYAWSGRQPAFNGDYNHV